MQYSVVLDMVDEPGVEGYYHAHMLTGPVNVFALTGPRSLAEFADNGAALDIDLSPAERAWLELEADDTRIEYKDGNP